MSDADMTVNDMLQWGAVAVILVIVIATIVCRVLRLRRQIKEGDTTDCGCGCSSCKSRCDLADIHYRKKDGSDK